MKRYREEGKKKQKEQENEFGAKKQCTRPQGRQICGTS